MTPAGSSGSFLHDDQPDPSRVDAHTRLNPAESAIESADRTLWARLRWPQDADLECSVHARRSEVACHPIERKDLIVLILVLKDQVFPAIQCRKGALGHQRLVGAGNVLAEF